MYIYCVDPHTSKKKKNPVDLFIILWLVPDPTSVCAFHHCFSDFRLWTQSRCPHLMTLKAGQFTHMSPLWHLYSSLERHCAPDYSTYAEAVHDEHVQTFPRSITLQRTWRVLLRRAVDFFVFNCNDLWKGLPDFFDFLQPQVILTGERPVMLSLRRRFTMEKDITVIG